MTQIKEAYVSFDVAKLLKENGFDEETRGYYPIKGDAIGRLMFGSEYPHNDSQVQISAPTQRMAMDWLTATKGIVIEIRVKHNTSLNGLPLFEYQYCIYNGMDKHLDKAHFFERKEECIDEAIRYCSENLI